MSDAISGTKIMRRRGRPATGQGRQTGLRIPADLDGELDRWIAEQADPTLTKPEAIRRLVRQALAGREERHLSTK
jgi:hypothetical protein